MKESNVTCDLGTCTLCNSCLPEWLPAVDVHRKNFKIKKGEQIFKEGDPATGIYFVYTGVVKVHKRWDSEKDLIIRFAKSGDMLGHLGLGGDPIYPISVTALEPVTVCYMEMPFFEKTLKVNSDYTYKLMRFFANELQESEKRMRNLAHMPVKARIAQAILALQDQFGVNNEGLLGIELTRQDISSYAGVSYETLFKVAQEFSQLKIIEMKGKSISIYKPGLLADIVKGSNL